MAQRDFDNELEAIEHVVRRHPAGVTARQVERALDGRVPLRTLQYRLKLLVDRKRLVKEGDRRWARFRPADPSTPTRTETPAAPALEAAVALGTQGAEIQRHVRQAPARRTPVGYDRRFLEAYRPNDSAYLSTRERAHLRHLGRPPVGGQQPAGTYARQILGRLLIDLSWNSSRLEGNTYSLLDTRRLIELGQEVEGGRRLEAQMILNHKDAIEFLVGEADQIGFNRYTILNLHALLANNLLADSMAAGRLRYIPIGIEGSVYHPLEVPQLIEECFVEILAKASAIDDPFEQAFFVMVQLPYLQPFDDVNKRTSRLAANIPLIRGNHAPLSFAEVPRSTYTEAILGVYELRRVELLKDVFVWAYERSAAHYAAVRQSLGEPDPFRMQYRQALIDIIGKVVRKRMGRRTAADHLAAWINRNLKPDDRERFRDIAESELLSLHEGNFARYRIRPAEFVSWRKVWDAKPAASPYKRAQPKRSRTRQS